MKKSCLGAILGLALGAVSTYGQGNISLYSYGVTTNQVRYGAGAGGTLGAGVNSSFTAGVYWAPGVVTITNDATGVADPATLGPLTLGTGSGSTAQFDDFDPGYFYSLQYFTITPYTNGVVTVVVVAYNGTNYATSAIRGHSAAFQVTPTFAPAFPPMIGGWMPEFSVFPVGSAPVTNSPVFTQQATNRTVPAGSSTTFSAAVTGDAPLAFQWRFNGTNIAGATNINYTIGSVLSNRAGLYSLRVTNIYGSATSSNALLTVVPTNAFPPTITLQPTNRTVTEGLPTTFSATVTGTAPLAYQWRFNGTNIFGATNAAYNIAAVQSDQAGPYSLRVTNLYGSAISSNAVLTVETTPPPPTAPAIYFSPSNRTVALGSPTTFSVEATGTAPLSFQWRFNGIDITNATSTTYTIASVQTNDAGFYSVLVTNLYGADLSSNALLTVTNVPAGDPPMITLQPTNRTVAVGSAASFSAAIAGTSPLSYQWRFNGVNITNGTNLTYIIGAAQTNQAGLYSLRVTNLYGAATSSNALLTVVPVTNPPPTCVSPPSGLVSWWPGENNANDVIDSNSGVLLNGTNYGPAEVGRGFVLDGVDDVIRVPASSNLNLGTQSGFTLEAWINPSDVTFGHPIMEWNDDSAGFMGLAFWIGHPDSPSGYLSANMYDGSVNRVINAGDGSIVSNAWQHVALTYTKSNGVARLFINGAMIAEQNVGTTTVRSTGNLYIGGRLSAVQPRYFKGIIDEPSVYNRALTTNEIAAIYAADGQGKCLPAGNAPVITQQPTNRAVTVGSPTTFSAGVSGTAPLRYQWRFNGFNITNATNLTYSIAAAQSNQAGLYSLRVTNLFGSALSSNALLTVVPPVTNPPPSGLVPQITSFSPPLGSNGTVVTLVGTNFSPVAASNVVYFGAVRAMVTVTDLDSLTVIVPAGATYAPPSVTVAGLTGEAGSSFLPTFDGTGATFNVGSFAPKVDLAADGYQQRVYLGDMDGDGKVDLVVPNDTGHSVSVFRNLSINGSLSATSFAARVDFPLPGSSYGAAIADIDGDGRLDIITANAATGSGTVVTVLRNTGVPGVINSNSFAAGVNFTTAQGPVHIAVADLDNDGKLDLAVSTFQGGGVSLLRNTSTPGVIDAGSFAPKVDLASGDGAFDVKLGDLDGDGRKDLVVVSFSTGILSVYRNVSSPGSLDASSFANKTDFNVGPSYDLAIGDVDGDGKPDLAVARYNNAAVAVLRNASTLGALSSNSFTTPISFATGVNPHGVALGDVDGDGRLDVAVAISSGANVSVLRNTASAGIINSNSFAAKVDFATAAAPVGVAIGDLNGDGRPDLVATTWGSSALSVLRNQVSTGLAPTFTEQPTNRTIIAGSPTTFSSAVSGTSPFAYQWRLNGTNIANATNASFTIASPSQFNNGLYSVRVTNVFGSVISSNAQLTVLVPPTITQQPTNRSVLLGSPTTINAAASGTAPLSYQWRFNGTDISGATNTSYSIASVQTNDAGLYSMRVTNLAGSATSTSAVLTVTIPTPPNITQNPTNRSVVAGSPTTFSVTATGTGTLAYQWRFNGTNIVGATSTTYTIAAVQENQGGLYSVRVTNLYGDAISSDALLTVLPPPPVPTIYSFAPDKAKVGDVVHLTGTNFSSVVESNIVYLGAVQALVTAASPTSLDVVVPSGATYAAPSVTVAGLSGQASLAFTPTYVGAGVLDSSSFAPKVDFTAGTGQATVAIGDLDGDGKPDLVTANSNGTNILVYRNVSSNGVITASSFAPPVGFGTGSFPYAYLADVDGDGKLDILVANNGNGSGNSISIFRNTSTPGVLNNSSFAARVNFTTGTGPLKIAAGDLDGDGKVDLAVSAGNTRVVSLLRNIGTPGVIAVSNTFAARVDIATNAVDRDVELADIDGDGKLDVVTTHLSAGTVSVLRNVSIRGSLTTSSFAPRVILNTGGSYNVGIGDLDGDGKPDLVVDNRTASVGVIRNLSTPGNISTNTFAAQVSYPTANETYAVAIGDVDGDGRPDLAVSDLNTSLVSVLRNTGVPGTIGSNSFAAKVDFTVGSGPRLLALADLDADGKPDLVAANFASSFVSVLKNTSLLPAPPTFLTQPVSQSVVLGDAVVFTANASNVLSYQWQFGGSDIAGATNASLMLVDAQLVQAGNYSVVASNLFGSTSSTSAALTVTVPDCVSAPAGIAGWWTGSGNALDSVGTNNGSMQNGTSVAAGKVGLAFTFNGSNDLVAIPASSSLDVGASGSGLTIEMWIKPANHSLANLLEWNDDTGPGGVAIWQGLEGAGTLTADVSDTTVTPHYLTSAAGLLTTNAYQHVAVTYDKATGTGVLYHNGSAVTTLNLGTFTPATFRNLNFGARTAGPFSPSRFEGGLDEVSIYNRALGSNEIAAIYGARGAGKCPIAPAIVSVTPASAHVNEGATVSFTATATGSAPLSYQWLFGTNAIAGATSATLTLSNVVYAQSGNYAVVVTNLAGLTVSSPVTLLVNRAPIADASATDMLLISPNGSNAVAVLDGSLSSDPDGEALTYAWFREGEAVAFASNLVAVTTLPVGTNHLTLVVSDGMASGSQAFAVEVITTSEAVDRLIELVQSDVEKANALLTSLRAALAAIDRSQPQTAINQLEAFKNKVQAQVALTDPELAAELLADAQEIIDSLNGGTPPALASLEITSISEGNNGKPHLKIKGVANRVHIVEMSTDMVNWTKVGVAGCCGGGEYQFDDAQAPAASELRFYRVVSPK